MTRSLLGSDQRLRLRLYSAIAALAAAVALMSSDAGASPTEGRDAPVQVSAAGITAALRLPGSAYVRTDTTDTGALGGFGASDNASRPIARGLDAAASSGLSLQVDLDAPVVWRGGAGLQVFLVNGTGEAVTLPAMDSRIDVVQEARVPGGAWVQIEHLPQSWCGNSYHRVTLSAGQLWSLILPRYTGSLPAELRVRLDGPSGPVYSAPFAGAITPGQLSGDIGHYTPGNLMDPYGW